jgi:hypothetical protein
MDMVCAVKDSQIMVGFEIVSKTKIRGIFALLKNAQCIGGANNGEGESVRLQLGRGINEFQDFREKHDSYLNRIILQQHLFIPLSLKSEILWQLEAPVLYERINELKPVELLLQHFFMSGNGLPSQNNNRNHHHRNHMNHSGNMSNSGKRNHFNQFDKESWPSSVFQYSEQSSNKNTNHNHPGVQDYFPPSANSRMSSASSAGTDMVGYPVYAKNTPQNNSFLPFTQEKPPSVNQHFTNSSNFYAYPESSSFNSFDARPVNQQLQAPNQASQLQLQQSANSSDVTSSPALFSSSAAPPRGQNTYNHFI